MTEFDEFVKAVREHLSREDRRLLRAVYCPLGPERRDRAFDRAFDRALGRAFDHRPGRPEPGRGPVPKGRSRPG